MNSVDLDMYFRVNLYLSPPSPPPFPLQEPLLCPPSSHTYTMHVLLPCHDMYFGTISSAFDSKIPDMRRRRAI